MRFIAFDLETTGTLPGVDRIVEIGAVLFVNGIIEATFSTLVNPGISIPEGASRVNGITDEMVANSPTIDRLLEPLADFCGEDLIVAHNAAFDTQFLTADIKKYECRAPRGLVFDTYAMAKKVYPGLPNYKLGTLVQHLKVPASEFHRAEADACYCGHLFLAMVERIGAKNVMPSVEQLCALTGRPAFQFPEIIPQPKQLELFV